MLSPAEREQRRLAANTPWQKQNPGPFMEMVRRGLVTKWEREVREEAEGPLPRARSERRVECKRRAHLNRLTLAAMRSRKKAAG